MLIRNRDAPVALCQNQNCCQIHKRRVSYGKQSHQILQEYVQQFGINVKKKKKRTHIYLFFSHQHPNFKSAYVGCWYCSRVEHCRNVLIQQESDRRVKFNFPQIKKTFFTFKMMINGTISHWCIPKWEPNQKSDLQMGCCNISSSSPTNIIQPIPT